MKKRILAILKLKKKILSLLRISKNKAIEYVISNRLFLSYTILTMLGCFIARYLTLGEVVTLSSFLSNLALILLFGSFGYLFRPSSRFHYYFFWVIIFTLIQTINTIYYKFYTSFVSFGEFATLGQTETVMDSVYDKLEVYDFLFILIPIIFYLIHRKLSKTSYYNFINKVSNGKKVFVSTFIVGLSCLAFILVTSSPTDFSRLAKQWNRVLNVERYGILFYQANDLIQTITPRISTLFGYEEAAEAFNEYFVEEEIPTNEYTGIFEGKNVVFIHLESIQTFLMDLSFNGEDVTPYLNQIASEGMFFNNFYPQISTGTSSDSEFSLLTSLFPAASGTVFVSYFNRYYESIPNILTEQNYHTFSMHGNDFSMWNRTYAHPSLGYQEFYFKDKYTFTEEDEIGLGINDSLWFDQSFDYLVEIENKYPNYMGTMITLSNHSPYEDVSKYSIYDLSHTYTNELGEEVTTDYLSDRTIGDYLKSAHFADQALGEFIQMVNDSENFDDTIFVLYGDHDARMSSRDMEYLLNYDPVTGEIPDEDELNYVSYDSFDKEIYKKTPLVIWTKDEELRKEINEEISYPMGMVDIAPTILNMMNLNNRYALGNDIFEVKENNYVIFPNVSFISDQIYYNNSTGEYKALKEGVILTENYISDKLLEAEEKLEMSNSIILHDLILKEHIKKETE